MQQKIVKILRELTKAQNAALRETAKRLRVPKSNLIYWQKKQTSPTWPPLPLRDFIVKELAPIKKQLGVIYKRVGGGGTNEKRGRKTKVLHVVRGHNH